MTSRTVLSPLEWEIMNIVWQFSDPPSVRDVLEKAYPSGEKAYTTVQTVLNKLESKGCVVREKIGMVNFYKPVKMKQDLLLKETRRFVDRAFGGSFLNLVNYLIDSDSLSQNDLQQLRELMSQEKERADS